MKQLLVENLLIYKSNVLNNKFDVFINSALVRDAFSDSDLFLLLSVCLLSEQDLVSTEDDCKLSKCLHSL
jgi:hypothetical protein